MVVQTATADRPKQDLTIDQNLEKLRELDVVFGNCEGWPGIRSPAVKDFIVKHQIQAEGWYVANSSLTVAETRRLERIGNAVNDFLDQTE